MNDERVKNEPIGEVKAGANINNPVIHVRHADLNYVDEIEQMASRAGQVFDNILSETMTGTINAVLGSIAGQSLMSAVLERASLKFEELPSKLELIDPTFRACVGYKPAKVLERSILRNIIKKVMTGCAAPTTDAFDFAIEVRRLREHFVKHKQAADRPNTLE